MRRFSGLRLAAAETRRILRDRFARYLPVMHQPAVPRVGNLIRDEQLLDLLLNLDIVCGGEIDRARTTYDAALPPEGGQPSFDEVYDAVKIFMPAGAKKPVYAPYVEHVPPDVTACIFWLKNRDPAHWRDAWQVAHTLGKYVISDKPMTEEEWTREHATLIDVTPDDDEKKRD